MAKDRTEAVTTCDPTVQHVLILMECRLTVPFREKFLWNACSIPRVQHVHTYQTQNIPNFDIVRLSHPSGIKHRSHNRSLR